MEKKYSNSKESIQPSSTQSRQIESWDSSFPGTISRFKDLLSENDQFWKSFIRRDWSNIFDTKLGLTIPAVNIEEKEKEYLISVAAPGMKKENFNIEVCHGSLCITAERKKQEQEKKKKYNRKEFSYSSFNRSFSLPSNVVPANISAKYDRGVLLIQLPKKERAESSTQKISVQ